MVFHVFESLAEFIRELIVQGTDEGLDAARARGDRLGRPPAMGSPRRAVTASSPASPSSPRTTGPSTGAFCTP
ncbi:hypothetical protein [Streptomyces sp. NPDC001970]